MASKLLCRPDTSQTVLQELALCLAESALDFASTPALALLLLPFPLRRAEGNLIHMVLIPSLIKVQFSKSRWISKMLCVFLYFVFFLRRRKANGLPKENELQPLGPDLGSGMSSWGASGGGCYLVRGLEYSPQKPGESRQSEGTLLSFLTCVCVCVACLSMLISE